MPQLERSESQSSLGSLLDEAARGRFPPADGRVAIEPAPVGKFEAVIGFTAFHVIASSVPEREVRSRLDPDDLGAPLKAPFLAWLADRLQTPPGMLDVVLAAIGTGKSLTPDFLVQREELADHPRIRRALHYRSQVSVYTDAASRGVLIVGRGLADRYEVSIEVDEAARGRGLARSLLSAACSLHPVGQPLFAQVSPGNAASLRLSSQPAFDR